MDNDFKYTEEDLKNIRKYGCSCRFDWPFVIYLTKRYNIENFNVNFCNFSGAIERSLKI